MSVAEILKELPKLSAEDREAVERKLGEIRGVGVREDPPGWRTTPNFCGMTPPKTKSTKPYAKWP